MVISRTLLGSDGRLRADERDGKPKCPGGSSLTITSEEGAMPRWLVAAACSLAGLFGSVPSTAHDWYPLDCCSNKDCRALVEINGETVLEGPEGWRLWDGR